MIWYLELIYSLTCCFGEVIALLDVFEVRAEKVVSGEQMRDADEQFRDMEV